MKAVQINNYGDPHVLEINNINTPKADEGKIVVEVLAASINPFDLKVLSGFYKEMMPLKFPVTPGGDFSGIIKEVGTGVTGFNVGDEVFGTASVFSGGSGSMAESAVVRVNSCAIKPKNISFEEAAALPLVASSAVQALEENIKLTSSIVPEKKQKILIHGGAGGIGHIAIQLAKVLGAYVITTVSQDDFEFVRSLGADEVIDYKAEKFDEKLKDLDSVFDTVGGQVTNKSIKILRPGGILVSMSGEIDLDSARKSGITAVQQATKNNRLHLNRVKELVEEGKIKINIAKIFNLDQIKEAFNYQIKGRPRGKVVIKI